MYFRWTNQAAAIWRECGKCALWNLSCWESMCRQRNMVVEVLILEKKRDIIDLTHLLHNIENETTLTIKCSNFFSKKKTPKNRSKIFSKCHLSQGAQNCRSGFVWVDVCEKRRDSHGYSGRWSCENRRKGRNRLSWSGDKCASYPKRNVCFVVCDVQPTTVALRMTASDFAK